MIDKDLEEYEKEYLERVKEQNKKNNDESLKKIEDKKRLEEEEFQRKLKRVEERRKELEELDNLTTEDYVALKSCKDFDPRLFLKIGTIEAMNSLIKLFEAGYIKKLDRPLTFSEKEKSEIFKDSAEYQQYEKRIKRIADEEYYDKAKEFSQKLDVKNQDDSLDITQEGIELLEKKKKNLELLLSEMKEYVRKNFTIGFKNLVNSNKKDLPLFMVMGLMNGTTMGIMMSKMDMNHEQTMIGMEQIYNQVNNDSYSDGGGDSGGFLDGGFQPGF